MNALPALSSDEVHVWRFDLMADSPTQVRHSQLLSADELQRASRFHFERDRRRFVVRRAILRRILAAYLDSGSRQIQLTAGPCGKPGIAETMASNNLQFSCSHSEDMGLVAVSQGKALGADIEVHRLMDSSLEAVTRFFAPAEREELDRVPAEHRTKTFFDFWTCKEAVVKALGLGLSFSLDRFVVSIGPGSNRRLVSLEGDLTEGERWQILALDMGLNCSAALVVEGDVAMVHSHVWNPDFTTQCDHG